MVQSKSNLDIVLGTMTFGENSRITDPEECRKLIELFKSYGHRDIDTARVYTNGTSEEFLGKIGTEGLSVATKVWPTIRDNPENPNAITHSAKDIEATLNISLAALQLPSASLYYLHAPDRTTPFSDSIEGLNNLLKAGKIGSIGISNFRSWEVAYICDYCKAKNLEPPKVYQGIYNVIHREVEPELLPCLKFYNIAFYAYNPLAGGFFTATGPKSITGDVEKGTRFDNSGKQGQMYRNRYWKEAYFKARDLIEPVAEKSGLTLVEIALRWMNHHSGLERDKGDKIIIGASSEKHLKENLDDLEKGPLPEEVVKVCATAWSMVRGEVEYYWR